jgi:hypothetical protein
MPVTGRSEGNTVIKIWMIYSTNWSNGNNQNNGIMQQMKNIYYFQMHRKPVPKPISKINKNQNYLMTVQCM